LNNSEYLSLGASLKNLARAAPNLLVAVCLLACKAELQAKVETIRNYSKRDKNLAWPEFMSLLPPKFVLPWPS
jgi:hypothetical protein